MLEIYQVGPHSHVLALLTTRPPLTAIHFKVGTAAKEAGLLKKELMAGAEPTTRQPGFQQSHCREGSNFLKEMSHMIAYPIKC